MWRELFTRAASVGGGASKQLAPPRQRNLVALFFQRPLALGKPAKAVRAT